MGKKDCITKDCLFDEELEACARCADPFDHQIINDRGFLKCTRCGGYEVDKTAELCKVCDAKELKICRVLSHILGWGFVIGLAIYLFT
jgi:hypothetical protein